LARRHRPDVRHSRAHGRHRQTAAIDREYALRLRRQVRKIVAERLALGRIVALDVDEKALARKGGEDSIERWHQPDALATEGKRLAAIRRIAVADVELLEVRERMLAR